MFRQLFSIVLFIGCINEVHSACWSATCGATEKIPCLAKYPLCARPIDARQELAAHKTGEVVQCLGLLCCTGGFLAGGFLGAIPSSCPIGVRVTAVAVPAVGTCCGAKAVSGTMDRIDYLEHQLNRPAAPVVQPPTSVSSSMPPRSLYSSFDPQ